MELADDQKRAEQEGLPAKQDLSQSDSQVIRKNRQQPKTDLVKAATPRNERTRATLPVTSDAKSLMASPRKSLGDCLQLVYSEVVIQIKSTNEENKTYYLGSNAAVSYLPLATMAARTQADPKVTDEA